MKTLMTGSHGFVGTNLVEALSGVHEIIRWDVRKDEELPECDAVIHLAGKAHDTKNRINAEEYFYVNTELTKKIYDAFLRSTAKKFIFFSSIKAKDNDTPYAKSKRAAEDYIMDKVHGSRFMVHGSKQVYILRPCMIHGKGVKGNLPLLYKYVKKGWPWPLAAFENRRSYACIGNVSYVVSELLKKDVETGTYNICDDEPISTNDLIRLISRIVGCEPKMLRISKGVVQFGAKMGDVLHLPLNTERIRKLTGDYIIDNSEIKFALGISQMPISAMDGLIETIEGLKKE